MNISNSIPLAVPNGLHREIKRGAKETGLSQADVMRQSIRLGLPQFVEQFPKPATPLPCVKKLSARVAVACAADSRRRQVKKTKTKGN